MQSKICCYIKYFSHNLVSPDITFVVTVSIQSFVQDKLTPKPRNISSSFSENSKALGTAF